MSALNITFLPIGRRARAACDFRPFAIPCVGATGPAAACIQAALSKARIQPFAKESFTANTTIRPP